MFLSCMVEGSVLQSMLSRITNADGIEIFLQFWISGFPKSISQ